MFELRLSFKIESSVEISQCCCFLMSRMDAFRWASSWLFPWHSIRIVILTAIIRIIIGERLLYALFWYQFCCVRVRAIRDSREDWLLFTACMGFVVLDLMGLVLIVEIGGEVLVWDLRLIDQEFLWDWCLDWTSFAKVPSEWPWTWTTILIYCVLALSRLLVKHCGIFTCRLRQVCKAWCFLQHCDCL